MINNFKGEYYFLSNFYPADITIDGISYKNNEAAFQAYKTLDIKARKEFSFLDPSAAKRKGRQVYLRSDWENVKTDVMYKVCLAKFSQNEDLKEKLLDTGDSHLEEGNTWGDKIWGTVDGIGENRLGKILMSVRETLKQQDEQEINELLQKGNF